MLAAVNGLPGTVRLLLVRGEGASFSAGLDRRMLSPDGIAGAPNLMALASMSTEQVDRTIGGYQEAFGVFARPGLVSIALVQGHAVGFIPGSDDPKYTASKIYPYILAQKPLLAIFNSKSPAIPVLFEYGVKQVYSYDQSAGADADICSFLKQVALREIDNQAYNPVVVKKYSAKNMAANQCRLFDIVLHGKN